MRPPPCQSASPSGPSVEGTSILPDATALASRPTAGQSVVLPTWFGKGQESVERKLLLSRLVSRVVWSSTWWSTWCVRNANGYAINRLFGFLLGSTLAGAGVYGYVLQEYKASNELLSEDIYVRFCI
jgi:hypothetical protein